MREGIGLSFLFFLFSCVFKIFIIKSKTKNQTKQKKQSNNDNNKKKPCGVTSANSSRRKLVREGVSCRHFYLSPQWVVRAGKNQFEIPGKVKILILESPCPSLKFRAGRLRLGSLRHDSAERIQSRRIQNEISHNCFKN